MAFDGNIDAMGQLADRLGDLASVPSRAAARVSREIAGLIEDEFSLGQDPYGTAWKPLAPATLAMGRTPPPLTDTWDMRKSVQVKPMRAAGISITIQNPPAAPHQTGWIGPQNSGPARPVLPARSELPHDWQEVIEAAVDAEVRRAR